MKQKVNKQIIALAAFLLMINWFFYFPQPAWGGDVNDLWGGSDVKTNIAINSGLPSEVNNDPRLIAAEIIREILGFLGILAVIIVLYAGFRWMTSGGSEDQISSAKKTLVAGLIGLVIILFAFALASFVINQLSRAIT